MRAFFAIPLPDDLARALEGEGARVSGLRAQAAATIHLTIRFLGEIADPGAILAEVAPVAASFEPFRLTLAGMGVFPHPAAARVLWVGLDEGAEKARILASSVEAAVRRAGLPPEPRPWSPHVTLGRFPRPRRLPPGALDPKRPFGAFEARSLVLFESALTPKGALHTVVRELSLGGGMKP